MNVFLQQYHRFFPPAFNISPQKSKFALNLQPHCRLSDSCLKGGGGGRGARHLCLLEKPLLLSPVTQPLSTVYSEQLWCQNQTKPKCHCPAPTSRAEWAGALSSPKCHFFLPSFLPLLVIPSRSASFSFSRPLFSFIHAGDDRFPQVPLPSSFYLIPPRLLSTHLKNQPAASVHSFIIDAVCAPRSAGVGVNFHSAGDADGKCNSDNDATAVASTLPRSRCPR